jgi:hypothetical protein
MEGKRTRFETADSTRSWKTERHFPMVRLLTVEKTTTSRDRDVKRADHPSPIGERAEARP